MNIEIDLEKISKKFPPMDAEFFKRVWSSDLTKFKNRIEAIQFTNKERVLDAGFGMGQWAVELSKLNKHVYGVEFAENRVDAVNEIVEFLNIKNVNFVQGSIEELPYEDNYFDAIFCYGVIFCTDYKKSLNEFYRVLKPGGKLYFSANGLGWSLYCIIEQHNKSESYDPRYYAIENIHNTLNYVENNTFTQGFQVIIDRNSLHKHLGSLGFNNTIINHEGGINLINKGEDLSFYKRKHYQGHDFIFEALTTK
jgi:ubiquinone/menaquinone biosynthesis C-methylase UbiE